MQKGVVGNRQIAVLLLTLVVGVVDGGEMSRPGGTVTFKGRFATDGSVAELRIVRSEPAGKFDQVATRSLRTWKVKPWWAKAASRGPEFAKTVNFFDDSALAQGAALPPPETTSVDGLVDDASWSQLFRIKYLDAPRWPNAAMSPLTGGWIRYMGTITTEGRVVDIKIVDSLPRRNVR